MSQKQFKKIDDPEELLVEIAKILHKLRIPYVITGGFAVAIWGKPRFTADIDVVVELLPKNIEKLSQELCALDKYSYLDTCMIKRSLSTGKEFNFIHVSLGMKVDFWIIDSEFDKKKIDRAIRKKIKNQYIKFISPEDLILSKLLWYKKSKLERELRDIKSVLRFSKVDRRYIRKKVLEHSTLSIFQKLIKKSTR